MKAIPFNKPYYTTLEKKFARDSVQRGQISGDGYYTKKVGEFIESTFNAKKALLTTSCSSALDMAALLLDLQEVDEVIMPSFTFVSTANPVVVRGAKPVFADINPHTLNINPSDIEKRITPKTKAIFPVHYAGVSCDMDEIMCIARHYHLKVVEDAAQGVNSKYKDKYLGTMGDIGCYSFHDTKNYTCGEGGAILINSDQNLVERAEIIREKGTNRSKFFRGEVDKYTWVDIGSSFLPSDILAAILFAQFKKLDEIQTERSKIYRFYYENLKDLERKELIQLPVIPQYCYSNYHIFYIILPSENQRNYLMDQLKKDGITAIFHYLPLHTSPMGQKLGYQKGDLPVTENLSARLLRLPMFIGLTGKELEMIVDRIYQYLTTKQKNNILGATG